MCCGCWEEYGSPKISNEVVWMLAREMQKVDGTSNPLLHVIVEDDNWEDHWIEDKIEEAQGPDTRDTVREWDAPWGEVVSGALPFLLLAQQATLRERAAAAGLVMGCWGHDNKMVC